jgi:hypothetical protein
LNATAQRERLLIPVEGPGHAYTLGGRPLVGVTSVIHTVLRAPQLEEWFKTVGLQADAIRDEAAAFGKSIHAAMQAHLTGATLIPLDMPESWQKTIDAGIAWLDRNVEEVLAVEQPIASAKYGYAGRPDLYAVLRKARLYRTTARRVPTIIDWKTTGGVYWSHPMQLSAYRQACKETYGDPPADRLLLLFSKDEPGKVTPYPFNHHDRDFALFGYMLGAYNLMKGGIA